MEVAGPSDIIKHLGTPQRLLNVSAVSDGSFQGLSLRPGQRRALAPTGSDGEGPETAEGEQVWALSLTLGTTAGKTTPGKSWPDHPALLGLNTQPFLASQCPLAGDIALPCSEETKKEEKREKGEAKYR